MYCVSCGKKNPDGAAFCAYCGKPIESRTQVVESELLPEGESAAREGADAREAADAHEPFKRPDPSRQVRPLPENPAQPSRRERRETADAAQPTKAQRPAPRPAQPRPARGAMSADGRMKEPPARKPPVGPGKKAGWTPPSTLIPKRRRRGADDLFFEGIDLPGERPYDELEDERGWSRKIKSAAAAVFLLAALAFVFWLLILPGGQRLRASLNMGAPASAYASLGDQYLNENSVKRAADAYYNALRLDPGNYDYALKVGKTQALVGDRNKALAAYAKCISLKEGEWEPYQAVADLYSQMGDDERALNALKSGYDKTGNLDLFRAYEAYAARGVSPAGGSEPAQ